MSKKLEDLTDEELEALLDGLDKQKTLALSETIVEPSEAAPTSLAVSNEAEISLFSQEIEETTQPEKISALVRETTERFRRAAQEAGMKPVLTEEGVVWEQPLALPETEASTYAAPDRCDVYFLEKDVKDLVVGDILELISNQKPAKGILAFELSVNGIDNTESKPNRFVIDRSLGSNPCVQSANSGLYRPATIRNIGSIVLVYDSSESGQLLCILSGICLEEQYTSFIAYSPATIETLKMSIQSVRPWYPF